MITPTSFVIQLKYCAMKVSGIKCCVIGSVVANIAEDDSAFIVSVYSRPRSRAMRKDWVRDVARGGIPDSCYLYKRPDLSTWLFLDCWTLKMKAHSSFVMPENTPLMTWRRIPGHRVCQQRHCEYLISHSALPCFVIFITHNAMIHTQWKALVSTVINLFFFFNFLYKNKTVIKHWVPSKLVELVVSKYRVKGKL